MTATLDFEATSHYLDGTPRLHYHEAGEGPALVMLHGSGPGVTAWSNYGANLPNLAQHFRTVLWDMPGFGRSERPELDRAYPGLAADILVRLLDGLGIERANLFGNSFGGYVSLEFALAHPDRVGRLVLMGPGGLAAPVLGPERSEGARRLTDFMLAPSREGMVAWVDTMVANQKVLDEQLIDTRLAAALAPGAIDNAVSIFLSLAQHPDPVPLWARLKDIKAPVLITWGRDDRMMPLEQSLFGYRQLPNAELHIFSKCGHWAQVERKDDLERLVVDFLTRP
jgi:4,5:9,10-diseco-3-hydroxy-5,9,17-trioxoandrosta-1(10),2-diene-4-oate hydrolase